MTKEKLEKLERMLLIYILFRQELSLKCKQDFKIPSERQLHDYGFDKLKEEFNL